MTEFRRATQDEVALMLDWAAAEGWNPGLEDEKAFFASDPRGFFIATSDGAPVAAISIVNHSETFTFLGLYIVREPFRGQGIGYGLWKHALDHAAQRTVGLDGVPDQQANYAASGFVHVGSTTRFMGHITPEISSGVSLAMPDDIPSLIAAEAAATGSAKRLYLSNWFDQTETRKTLVLSHESGKRAFCTVRQCRDGAKIGPLLAQDASQAQTLLQHAASVFDGPFSIDVPESSSDLIDLCKRLGLIPGFETARMYRGPAPQTTGTVFAVTTLELG